MNGVVRDAMPVVCIGLGLMYAVLTVGHLALLPASFGESMAWLAATSAMILTATALLLFRHQLPLDWAHPVALGVASIVVINSLAHLYLAGEDQHSINLLLVLVGASCFFISTRWFVALVMMTLVPWALVASAAVPGFDWTHYGFALFVTLLLSAIILVSRKTGLRRTLDLRASEAAQSSRLEAVIGSSLDAIISIDHRDRITGFNPAAEETFGYSHEEILGSELAENVVPETLREAHRAGIKRYLSDRRSDILGKRLSMTARRRDGSEFPVELVIREVESSDDLPAFVGYVRDLTEARANEERIQAAKERAEVASRAKSEFLARMSHEVRTPMNAILGLTDLVLEGELSREQREFLERSHGSGEYLLALLDDILDLSKIEAGRFDLESRPFSLRGLLEETLRSLWVRADQKGLELILDCPGDVPHQVVGDPVRLRQILTNLVGNAIKFTDRGWIRLAVEPGSKETGQGTLQFAVEDTGPGVPEELRSEIFGQFTQLRADGSPPNGGAGLGLAICARLVEMMGGEIRAEGREGGGARFAFTAALDVLPNGADEESTLVGHSVLLGCPLLEARRALERTLRGHGAEVTALASASEVGRALQSPSGGARFDLVLLDELLGDPDALVSDLESAPGGELAPFVVLDRNIRNEVDVRPEGATRLVRVSKPLGPIQLERAALFALGLAPAEPASPSGRDWNGTTGAGLELLVVEDNETNLLLLLEMLRRRGHRVQVATSGRLAVERCERGRFDAILMDLEMPDLDGYAAVARIRALDERAERRTPIVAVTASATQESQQRALSAGFDAFVRKPIRVHELMSALGSLLAEEAKPDQQLGVLEGKPSGRIVDEAELLAHVDGDVSILERVAAVFVESSAQDLDALGSAVNKADSTEIRRLSHKLLGALGDLAAPAASAAVEELRGRARDGDVDTLAEHYARVRFEVGRLQKTLAEIVDRRSAQAPRLSE